MKKLKKIKLKASVILKEDEMKKVTGGYSGWSMCDYTQAAASMNGSSWGNAEWDKWADEFMLYCT